MGLLAGKVVVITGAAGRLGSVFTSAVVQAGGAVVAADLVNEHTRPALDRLVNQHGEALLVAPADITDRRSLDEMIEAALSRFGRIDSLVNNAYPRNEHYGRRFDQVEYKDFVENVGMHAGGYFLAAQRFIEHFKKQGHGNIVNMSSIYGVVAPRFEVYEGTDMTMPVEYAVIKSGIVHLTRYIASWCAGMNIRCNAISPGGIEAGQPEAFLARYREHAQSKGMLDAQDITGTLVFLLSELSSYMNGQNIVVDDGWSL